MSVKSSIKLTTRVRLLRTAQAVLWVALCFVGAQILVGVAIALASDSSSLMGNVGLLARQLVMLGLTVVALLWLPRLWGDDISRAELGLTRPMRWSDIGWALVGIVAAYGGSMLLSVLAQWFMSWVDLSEPQNLGLSALNPGIEMSLAFLTLVIIGPIAEEVIFRGYLYGRLQALQIRFWVRTLVVSALFALAHWQWNVALDVFILSVIMCVLREKTDSLWPSIIMHMVKNGVAFYFMFVNPLTTGIM